MTREENMSMAEKRVKLEEFGLSLLDIEERRMTYTKQGKEAYEGQRPAWEARLRELIGDVVLVLDLGELDEMTGKILEIGRRLADETPSPPPSDTVN
jgi:hypothetical protein